jgi:hypothetical protein
VSPLPAARAEGHDENQRDVLVSALPAATLICAWCRAPLVGKLQPGRWRYCNRRCRAKAYEAKRETAEIERVFAAAKAAIQVRRRNTAGA